jgi:hypothetical protein
MVVLVTGERWGVYIFYTQSWGGFFALYKVLDISLADTHMATWQQSGACLP